MSKARVAIMLPKFGRYGGVEGFGWRLAQYLAHEFDVTFICARQEEAAPHGVRVCRVGRPPGNFCKTLWFALAAERVRRQGDFAVSIGLGKTIFQDILRLSGGPTPLFWAMSLKAYPPGWPRFFKRLGRILAPGKQLGRLIEARQIRASRVLVANSHFVRDMTRQAFGDVSIAQVIYNQPDLTRFAPGGEQKKERQRFGLPPDAHLVLTAGTNFRLKGVYPLLNALSLLPPTFHLAVAGGRSAPLALVRELGLTGRVHFLGRVDDMPALYRAADIFVLNTFYDACANAVLEALACGLPTLSTAQNGSSVFLRPEAVLPDPLDTAELARRIQAHAGHGSTARTDFAPKRGLEPYAELIRSLTQS